MNLHQTPEQVIEQRKAELLDRLCEVWNLDPEEKATTAAKAEIEHILMLVGLNSYNAGQREARDSDHPYEDFYTDRLKEYCS